MESVGREPIVKDGVEKDIGENFLAPTMYNILIYHSHLSPKYNFSFFLKSPFLSFLVNDVPSSFL